MNMKNNAVLNKCKHCGSTPELHRKGNKYYYECSGDCWAVTAKHWTPEEAAEEWDRMNSPQEDSEETVKLMPLHKLLQVCMCCQGVVSACGACPLEHEYDCTYIRRDQLRRWYEKIIEELEEKYGYGS